MRVCLDGEDLTEEADEHTQCDKPESDSCQNPPGRSLDGRRCEFDSRHDSRLALPDGDRDGEQTRRQDDGGAAHRAKRGTGSTRGDGKAGQTGQDRPSSTETGQHV